MADTNRQDVNGLATLDVELSRKKIEAAKGYYWGAFNVHPYLEIAGAALDEIERLHLQVQTLRDLRKWDTKAQEDSGV